jgi:hypothetical protein
MSVHSPIHSLTCSERFTANPEITANQYPTDEGLPDWRFRIGDNPDTSREMASMSGLACGQQPTYAETTHTNRQPKYLLQTDQF